MVAIVDAAFRAIRELPARWDEAIGALNGLVGDLLEERNHSLAIPMALRVDGEPTPRLCVMVHGLMATDARWTFRGRPGVTYATLLAADRGVTPVYVSYNSGRHISANGRELAAKLDELVAGWPVPVTEIDFVGHSVGGLVARSACHYAVEERRPWAEHVRRIFLLGAPNRGATMEQIAHYIQATLRALPVGAARALARLGDRRSAGIKDLRRGSIVDDDWQEGRRHAVAIPAGADVFVARAAMFGAGDDPVRRAVGDVLVSHYSATARRPLRRAVLCPDENVAVFRGGHLRLANDPEVYAQILRWWPPELASDVPSETEMGVNT